MLNSHSIQKQNALTGFFGINQQWLKTCTKFMEKMKKAMLSKHGPFSVRIDSSNLKKCDIFATPTYRTYSGDLTLIIFLKKIFSKIRR